MSIRLAGTRIEGSDATSSWFEPLPNQSHGAVMVAAFWDASSGELAERLSRKLEGLPKLLLWINGGTGPDAWEKLNQVFHSESAEIRFVNNPTGGGIFHVKANGITDAKDAWLQAYVGSANLTANAYAKNIEIGAVFSEPAALTSLQSWFEDQWKVATPFSTELYDKLKSTVAENSIAANMAKTKQKVVGTELVPPALATSAAPPISSGGSTPEVASTANIKKWWKKMSASDAAQYGANTHAHSKISLTIVRGRIPDPDTFFHDHFFVENWESEPGSPGQKKLEIIADVRILGVDHGRKSVKITWNKSRGPNSHGRATHIHLKPNLESLFQQSDLTHKYVVLSRGPTGYLIEVVEDEPKDE